MQGEKLSEAKIADCVPSDESGHLFRRNRYGTAKRRNRYTSCNSDGPNPELYSASTTVIWAATHPEDDDDGDGWGDGLTEEDRYDCDDSDPTVYPSAAEIYDGKDNDCDGAVDENTLGNDDDGDTVSEAEGDCDDADADSYLERLNSPT